jgi:hypothetical protein
MSWHGRNTHAFRYELKCPEGPGGAIWQSSRDAEGRERSRGPTGVTCPLSPASLSRRNSEFLDDLVG